MMQTNPLIGDVDAVASIDQLNDHEAMLLEMSRCCTGQE